MVPRFIVVVVTVCVLTCDPAAGATVTLSGTVYPPDFTDVPGYGIEVKAGPGERNRLTVTLAGTDMVLRDTAGLQTSAPCTTEDAQTVHCPLRGGLQMSVYLGDGDDTFAMPRFNKLRVYGEEGNDVITAEGNLYYGGESAYLFGGPGDDRLSGERVVGGPGNDVLKSDWFDFSEHTAGVDVDLPHGRATSAGEHDQLLIVPGTNPVSVDGGSGPDAIRAAPGRRLVVEAGAGDDSVDGTPYHDVLLGGPGDDILRGGGTLDALDGQAGDDRLEGGSGPDDMQGGAGDDVLIGGPGRDDMHGGSGADRLLARDGERDTVDCVGRRMEPGDRAIVDADDRVDACRVIERAGTPRLELHAIVDPPGRGRTGYLVASCPRAAKPPACTGRIRIGVGRRAVRRPIQVAPGHRERVRVPLADNGSYPFRAVLRTGQVLRGTLVDVNQ